MDADILYRQNPHWNDGFSYPYPKKRALFPELKKNLAHPLAVGIIGPRRVGKTVLMKQLIDELILGGVKRERILYVSCEEGVPTLKDAISTWEKYLSIDLRNHPNFIFIDEIQFLDDWAAQLKFFYDNYPKAKFYFSGSASLSVRKGRESLAGRMSEFLLPALSFDEYLDLLGSTQRTSEQYSKYLFSQLPELVLNPIPPQQYVNSIVKKVIYEDAPQFYGADSPELLEQLFRLVCRSPGAIITYENISKDFNVSRNTASKYLDILTESLLLRRLYNFSKNARKTEVRSKKYYPFFPTLCAYVLPAAPDFPLLVETDIAAHLDAQYFWNDRGEEIDFIVGANLKTGIEAKMRARVDGRDARALIKNKLGLKRRILVVREDSTVSEEISKAGIGVERIIGFQNTQTESGYP